MRPAAKKRRRASASQKPRKAKKPKTGAKPQISVLKQSWDPKKTQQANLSKLGLVYNPNAVGVAGESEGGEAAREKGAPHPLFGAPNFDNLKEVDRNLRKRPLPETQQSYAAIQLQKHLFDYTKMFWDTETNYMQMTEGQLRRLCRKYLGLEDKHRLVPIPADVASALEKQQQEGEQIGEALT